MVSNENPIPLEELAVRKNSDQREADYALETENFRHDPDNEPSPHIDVFDGGALTPVLDEHGQETGWQIFRDERRIKRPGVVNLDSLPVGSVVEMVNYTVPITVVFKKSADGEVKVWSGADRAIIMRVKAIQTWDQATDQCYQGLLIAQNQEQSVVYPKVLVPGVESGRVDRPNGMSEWQSTPSTQTSKRRDVRIDGLTVLYPRPKNL